MRYDCVLPTTLELFDHRIADFYWAIVFQDEEKGRWLTMLPVGPVREAASYWWEYDNPDEPESRCTISLIATHFKPGEIRVIVHGGGDNEKERWLFSWVILWLQEHFLSIDNPDKFVDALTMRRGSPEWWNAVCAWYEGHKELGLTQREYAEKLGYTERHFKRELNKYRAETGE